MNSLDQSSPTPCELLFASIAALLLTFDASGQTGEASLVESPKAPPVREKYDVVIVGGSTAALAAAVASAESGASTALLEPTDWVGGQLTSSGVPAVDEAWHQIRDKESGEIVVDVAGIARDPRNMSPLLRDMLLATGNPGKGWVSRFCFEPRPFLKTHLEPLVRSVDANLDVFLDAVVKRAELTRDGKSIFAVEAIQRFPRAGVASNGYDRLPSRDLTDWYSPQASDRFDKRTLRIAGTIFIDASEWGELLALSGATYRIGVEHAPDADECYEQLGQSITFGLVQRLSDEPAANTVQHDEVSNLGYGDYEDRENAWSKIWTYRRIRGTGNEPTVGDLSLQNWGYSVKRGHGGNDYPFGYLFKTRHETQEERSDWTGGIHLDVLAAAEQRALAWHSWLREQTPPPFKREQVQLDLQVLGTGHGLAKLPYIRDTRRSVGVDGFVLKLADLTGEGDEKTAKVFDDRIALGAYAKDIHPLAGGDYPEYVHQASTTRPFTIPLRALTNRDFPNLLVAGKTMAQTFMANSATRLHPIEWSTGTAAGVVAAYAARTGQSTSEICEAPAAVQQLVQEQTPIDWHID